MSEKKKTRKQAYSEGLPSSFIYKLRAAFYAKACPLCGSPMEKDREFGMRKHIPTIQHNMPISLGGKHEIENISVICLCCNTSLRNKPTGALNNSEVVKKWNEIRG